MTTADLDVQIDDVSVVSFTYETRVGYDSDGHAHPGPPRTVTQQLLRVRCAGGAEGFAFGIDRHVVSDVVEQALIGHNAFDREFIWRQLAQRQRDSSSRLLDSDLASVDVALWDLAGRALNMPVYRLLGGFRDTIPAYASTMCGDELPGGLSTPEQYADFAEKCRDLGYKGFKLHSWMPPHPLAPSVDRDIAACRAIRERVGDSMDLMLDPYHCYDRQDAKRLGRALEELGFLWMEEPMRESSISSYQWLTAQLDLTIVGPETAGGQLETRAEWAARGASDVLRAGVRGVGGLTPLMKSIHLAEAFGMSLEVHGPGAESLHALAAMPIPGRYYERGLLHPLLDYDIPPPWLTRAIDPMDADGNVQPPDGPGFGWDIDWDYITAHEMR